MLVVYCSCLDEESDDFIDFIHSSLLFSFHLLIIQTLIQFEGYMRRSILILHKLRYECKKFMKTWDPSPEHIMTLRPINTKSLVILELSQYKASYPAHLGFLVQANH